ncbi:hypothetical protein C8Q77DRAFT_1138917 [Trametes polyzona]|nr:hypothetical protein C8Q77DRAFT_1138917 [Trametes polyzona]
MGVYGCSSACSTSPCSCPANLLTSRAGGHSVAILDDPIPRTTSPGSMPSTALRGAADDDVNPVASIPRPVFRPSSVEPAVKLAPPPLQVTIEQPQPQRRDSIQSWPSSASTLQPSLEDEDALMDEYKDKQMDDESVGTADDPSWLEFVVYDPATAREDSPPAWQRVAVPRPRPRSSPRPSQSPSVPAHPVSKAEGKRRCWDGVLRSVRNFFALR